MWDIIDGMTECGGGAFGCLGVWVFGLADGVEVICRCSLCRQRVCVCCLSSNVL